MTDTSSGTQYPHKAFEAEESDPTFTNLINQLEAGF